MAENIFEYCEERELSGWEMYYIYYANLQVFGEERVNACYSYPSLAAGRDMRF